jgi:F-type H+-transporting ATPase subunit b
MSIDWFTVVAQILNFLILLWLMKRFLYKPILQAIDEREKRIAGELADAEAKQTEALKLKTSYEQKSEDLDQQRETLVAEAKEEARIERARLLDEARQEVETFSAKRWETLRHEERTLHKAIVQKTKDSVFAIVRKTLTDLAGTSVEERMVEAFNNHLRDLDKKEVKALRSALVAASGSVSVLTAFEVPRKQQTAIEASIKEILGTEAQATFEIAPDLISGVELRVKGEKVAWSIAGHLALMEDDVAVLLKEQAGSVPPKTKSGSK